MDNKALNVINNTITTNAALSADERPFPRRSHSSAPSRLVFSVYRRGQQYSAARQHPLQVLER